MRLTKKPKNKFKKHKEPSNFQLPDFVKWGVICKTCGKRFAEKGI